jgi:hypothetical protein
VTVEGLEIMNDDPSEVDVLYAKVIHQKKILFKFFLFLKVTLHRLCLTTESLLSLNPEVYCVFHYQPHVQ